MATARQIKDDALARINAAITVLEKFPMLDETNTRLSFGFDYSPSRFLMDAFKSIKGSDMFIHIITGVIYTVTPVLEASVKTILLTNLKNLLNCSLNPIISDTLLREGLVFDLKSLDMFNILSQCPLDKYGKCYYYGCEDFENTDQLALAADFNAFMWYVKNKHMGRSVWYGYYGTNAKDYEGNTHSGIYKTRVQVPVERPEGDKDNDDKKKYGILTLEYNERSSGLRNALHKAYTPSSPTERSFGTFIPHNNCLHVFIGNTHHLYDGTDGGNVRNCENDLKGYDEIIDSTNTLINTYKTSIEEYESRINELKDFIKQSNNKDEIDGYKQEIVACNEAIEGFKEQISNSKQELEDAIDNKAVKLNEIQNMFDGDGLIYKDIKHNYYYRHTLMEFNTDYIFSVKLFDPKVIAAQLIDSLTLCLDFHAELSFERLVAKQMVQQLVKDIIECEEGAVTVDDCLFTFSEKSYTKMLKKAENIRRGIYENPDGNTTDADITAESLMDELNNVSVNSSEEELKTAISNSLMKAAIISSKKNPQNNDQSFNTSLNISTPLFEYNLTNSVSNFIDHIIEGLVYTITMTVMSPKVYLLMAVNLKTLGERTEFKLEDFLAMYQDMMTEIIRQVRDLIFQAILDELNKLLAELSRRIAASYITEQMEYYYRLITRLLALWRKYKRKNQDFDVGDFEYADIDNTEAINEFLNNNTNKQC